MVCLVNGNGNLVYHEARTTTKICQEFKVEYLRQLTFRGVVAKETCMNNLDKFGRFVIENLRDKAIREHLMLQRGELRAKTIQELQSKVGSLSDDQRDILHRVVIDVIDTALHDVLFAIQDAHDRNLGIEIHVDGQNVAEQSGMLQGEPLGESGWIKRFSKFPKI